MPNSLPGKPLVPQYSLLYYEWGHWEPVAKLFAYDSKRNPSLCREFDTEDEAKAAILEYSATHHSPTCWKIEEYYKCQKT